MNKCKAAYCRIFQKCFKIAIPFLPYRHPEVFYSTSKLTGLFAEKGIDTVLIITDAGIRKFGLLDRMLMHFDHHNIHYFIYDKTVANPTTTNVEEARELYLEKHCDAIIGFGGGSSIDCAKAVGARIAKPKQSLSKMKGILKVHKKLPLLVAIPTTAGTGSETTLAAVITDARTRHKYAINDFPLIPAYAVLDPKVTISLPPSLTATTGMDALTHAVEAYIGGSTTRHTRKYAKKATKLIFDNIYKAYDDGQNIEARKEMLKASFFAVPKATTITSSIACASSFIVTLIRVFPAIGSCCGSKPTNVTTSVPFTGAESVYSPAVLVVVPREVPSTMTVAPATGCPFASETVPEICLFWAVAYAKNTNTAINDSTIFLTISVNFN